MSNLFDSKILRSVIEKIVRSVVAETTRDCFRVLKATVETAPYEDSNLGPVCQVKLIGDETALTLPYSTKMSGMQVGDVVLIAVVYGSFRNAIVWEKQGFNA